MNCQIIRIITLKIKNEKLEFYVLYELPLIKTFKSICLTILFVDILKSCRSACTSISSSSHIYQSSFPTREQQFQNQWKHVHDSNHTRSDKSE